MDARVKSVIDTMHQRLSDKVSVSVLSRKVNLSPGRLRELFQKETGRSPKQYVKDLRMQRAEQLLRSTFLSIKEITFQSGARDVSHFVRDFKKEFGVTPSDFRVRSGRCTQTSPALGMSANEPRYHRLR